MNNVKNKYEAVLVLSMKLGEEGIPAMVQRFKELIEANGTLNQVDEWGKRKLAYPVKDEPEGYYVLFNFESQGDLPAELDRVSKITDGVLRSLIIKL